VNRKLDRDAAQQKYKMVSGLRFFDSGHYCSADVRVCIERGSARESFRGLLNSPAPITQSPMFMHYGSDEDAI
jgi:hypothetical protein